MLAVSFASLTLLGASLVSGAPNVRHTSTRGAVACESQLCSDVGGEILKKGGNAADAMIATVLCVGTVDPHHSGIGGGGFALVRTPKGKYSMIDFRETAPALANETMYSNNSNPTASTIGGLAVGVPGELRGLETIHKAYGRLSWKSLFQPAIKIARDGFVIQAQLGSGLNSSSATILADPALRAVFAPNGTVLTTGDILRRGNYSKTLEAVADHGADWFYNKKSWIAQANVKATQAQGGILTLADLESYKTIKRTPATINYRGYKLVSTVAPSSGTVALSALNILNGYNLTYVEKNGVKYDSNLTTQRIVESMKFAYGQRTVLGDPAFVKNVTALEFGFLAPTVAAEIRGNLSDTTTGPPALYDPAGYEILETHGTSAMTTADEDGLVVSLTTTVNLYFGSKVLVPETGVIMNDEMDDFSSPGSSNSFGYISTPSNYIVPGKRPLSSISPTIVEDANGNFVFTTCAAGGSRIITANIQTLHHVLDQGWSAQQAINAPRLHDQIFPQVTTYETASPSANVSAYDPAVVAYLAGIGHNMSVVAPGVSISAAVRYNPKTGVFDGAADPRIPGSGHVVV